MFPNHQPDCQLDISQPAGAGQISQLAGLGADVSQLAGLGADISQLAGLGADISQLAGSRSVCKQIYTP